ncbi:RNA helicase [Kluyveromyces lactis]|uniref:KLLA0D03058p n=1 Tax=Kluyveromyces lactis (strain ATCC 8585 / CBS 2359 / DSM 70799 / NBRC 1267 / NRRL Y-1140 / WM37) TaxID=284590 RepID=Q6CS85_KLULA|nr:uncharacterized protein KLLA0_D03058g [Kluyveromyces lactis]CAH00300.1 KLLA0D03058p [Kluyveromyces lactis]|eukprot:XP_453204.1 uncharacterized protein KLLA0_D03058g [Kluyveromyces lactis]
MAKKKKNVPVQELPTNDNNKGKKGSGGKNKREPLSEEEKAKRLQSRANVTSSVSWTGKLPHSVLHEYCQKQKWNKVEYDMKKIGDKGLVSTALISCTDPKTKETLVLRMSLEKKEIVPPQSTPAEARHYAATVALHRIAFNSKLYLMLPPNHKNLWYDLEDFRKALLKENPGKCARLFDEDPFETMVRLRKEKEQQEKKKASQQEQDGKNKKTPVFITSINSKTKSSEGNKKIQQNVTYSKIKNVERPAVTFPKKVWDSAPFFDFDESSRRLIENSLRKHIDWDSKLYTGGMTDERELLKSKLLNLGFRSVHVEEAMTFKDPLSFLICNLPEDDLPHFFQRRKEESLNKIEIANLPLNKRNMIDSLCELGNSKEETQLALEECDYNEAEACLKLLLDIYPINVPQITINEDEVNETWNQELEALKSIYESNFEQLNASSYKINLNDEFKIKLKVYKTKSYPQTLPGIVVSTFDKSYKLPNYIKLTILEKLLHFLEESQLIGDMCVYHIVDWLQQNLSEIIENPGPLLTKERIEITSNNLIKSTNKKRRFNARTSKLSNQEVSELEDEYRKRQKSNEFHTMREQRSKLPAWKIQNSIVELINSNDVVLITGETGSGKSTQVVQFVLDNLMQHGDLNKTSIICTQPRRISAIGLAERVSQERCVKCGDEVGYIIRGVNLTKSATRIKFMTTGVLVRILQGDVTFLNDCVVVIDEVHERSIDTDLIIILLKNLLKKVKGMKLILMSATVNVDVFKAFFKNLKSIHIEGRTFPIQDYFLDDVLKETNFKIRREQMNYSAETNEEDMYLTPTANSKFFTSGQINYDLIAETVFHVHNKLLRESNDGSLIVFLPGVGEVNRCCKTLSKADSDSLFEILPLHSALTPDDQKRVFKKFKSRRKIIISTNIAETSITVDDCVATIDTGRVKTLNYDPSSNTSKLVESFVSKAEAKQRRGRAGRVRSGYSYKLYSKKVYESMAELPVPEIKRVTLESLYLSVRSMGIKNVTKFLQQGLDPPPLSSLEKAEQILTTTGLIDETDNTLTQLGKFVSLLPVMDSKHGKLLIFSILFGCTDIGVLIASLLSVGTSIFINEYENRVAIREILVENENLGDVLAVVLLLNKYINLEGASKRKFLKDHLLSYNKVTEIMSSRTQFYSNLKDIGFLPFDYKPGNTSSEFLNRNAGNFEILKCVISGSFYPSIARVQLPEIKFVATGVGAVEKDQDAKLTKYWIRNEEFIDQLYQKQGGQETNLLPASRAFVHPSSLLFSASNSVPAEAQSIESIDDISSKKKSKSKNSLKAPFVVYNGKRDTGKLYLTGITPTSAIAVLLFGGSLSYNLNSSLNSPNVVVDNWSPIRIWCKNGVLIKELRSLVDEVIKEKLENPHYVKADYSTKGDDVLKIVEQIVKSK